MFGIKYNFNVVKLQSEMSSLSFLLFFDFLQRDEASFANHSDKRDDDLETIPENLSRHHVIHQSVGMSWELAKEQHDLKLIHARNDEEKSHRA